MTTHQVSVPPHALRRRAAALLEIDEDAALRLLTRHCDLIPPSSVVPSLQVRPDCGSCCLLAHGLVHHPLTCSWRRALALFVSGLWVFKMSQMRGERVFTKHVTSV